MYQAKNQSTKHAAGGMQRPPSWAHPSLWGRYGFDSFDSSSLWLIQQGGAISKQSTSSNSNSNSNKTTKITMASEEVTTPSKRTWAKAREESNQLVLQAAMQDVEQEAVRMRQQRDDLKSQLNSQFEESKQSKEKLAEVQASLASKEHLAATASQEATTNKREFQSLQETMKTKEERMDRLERESDSLREEISRLDTANLKLKEQLVEMETQAKLGDSEVVPLRYQVQRLNNEVDTISAHSQWVQDELSAKNEQLASLKASQASELAQLRADFDSAVMDKESANSELVALRRRNEQLDSKVEHLSKDLHSTRQEASATTLAMEHELVADRRLVSLQKESLARLQQRHDAVVQEMENLQALANEAQQDSRQEVAQIEQQMQAETKQILEDQAAEYKQQVVQLKKQAEDANRRRVAMEDGLLLTNVPASRRTTPARLALRDRAEATGDDDEPLNLTDLYTRLAETEDQLQAESTRRKRAEILLARTKAEIEATAPTLVRQRQEYELAIERSEENKKRVDGALQEAQASRNETSELQLELSRLQKCNKELDQETVEMAKQVQALLVSRSGGEADSNVPISVEEIQTQNQQLLREHRRLTTAVADLEQQVKQDPLRNKLESKEKELEVLKEDRQRQMATVESIVQQRDLYRTLVSKLDSNILGSSSEETTALTVVKQQSERTKTLEYRNDQLENDLHAARSELAAIAREKEATSERLARYETLTTDLTSSVDRLQLQVSSAKADVARSEADASFHKEKSARLEEALQRSRDEVARATSSKNDLQRITADLQKAVSVANGQAGKSENELKQAEMTLRLAKTQAETAKAAERRIAEEANQLRNELARQGALLDSVQRIEASLSARTAAEQESMNEQVTRLTQQISTDKTKYSTEVENLSGKIQQQETRMKELELNGFKATKEALEAKRESLKAATEVQTLKKNCDTLESQLRTAKRKLGESGDDEDVEAQLQNKINGLETQLETAKTEIATLKERNATYQKLAKDRENALAELTEATKETKEVHENEIADLKSQLESTKTESTKRHQVITELTNDLAAHRGDQDKAVAELNKQMSTLKSETENFQKDAESATSRFTTLETEVVSLRAEVSSAQNNYERELSLHSAARTDLRATREETESEIRLRKATEEQLENLKSQYSEQRSQWEEEKSSLENSLKQMEKGLTDSRAQNSVLHSQLETLGDQIEKRMSEVTDGADEEEVDVAFDNMRKTITELREVVKFLRSDKEMIQAQLDSAVRAAERERAAAAVVKRSLDAARAELKVLEDSSAATAQSSSTGGELAALKEKMATSEEKSRLLGESNTHLREEVYRLNTSVSGMKGELEAAKNSAQPHEKQKQTLELEKAALLSEKESLLREIDAWKGRVQSLVSKFNQVDPEEHASALKKVESLEKEISSLKSKRTEAEEESKRIRQLALRASKELMQNKTLVETQKKTLQKLNEEKESLAKSSKDTVSSKVLDALKEKMTKLQAERASEKLQLEGANGINDKLRERLRQFQKLIQELRKREALLADQLKDTQTGLEKHKEAPSLTKAASANTLETTGTSAPSSPHHPDNTAAESSPTDEKTGGEKDGAAVVPAKETTAETAASAKPAEKVVPKVPPGGFKFGPSESTPKEEVPTQEETTKQAPVSKKRPIAESKDEEPPETKKKLNPAATEFKPPAKDETTTEPTSQSAGEQAVGEEKSGESSADASKPALGRRMSGETKEMSMKEKLLEKKRKLMLAMKKVKEAQVSKEEEKDEGGRATKRSKPDEPAPPANEELDAAKKKHLAMIAAAAVSVVTTKKEEMAKQESEKNDDDAEDGEMDETPPEGEETGEDSKESEQPLAAADFSSSTAAPAVSGFGSSSAVKPFGVSTFGQAASSGGAKSVFGQPASSAGAPAVFGQPASAAGAPTAFGQPAASSAGTMSGFGQASSGFGAGTATGFGSSSGFGQTPAASSSTGFGGAFLNIKPPGSSTAPPQFTFGSSSSITLPTPAQKSPQNNMFNAFSSPTPFNSGGVTAKPLFGASNVEKVDEPAADDEDEEDGEMVDEEGQEPDV